LRHDNPNTSFSKQPPEEVLAAFEVYPVKVLPRPPSDPLTQYLKQSDFYQVDGRWQVHYYPEPLPEAQASANIRTERDALLAKTDWQVMPDSPHDTEEVRAYRQALRDVPSQAGFPYNVVWPVPPA
jgi:hypothetical protein